MRYLLSILLFLTFNSGHIEANTLINQVDTIKSDSLNRLRVNDFFSSERIKGNIRYFSMATDNSPGYTDYYANALGFGLKYETPVFKRFSIGLSAYLIKNIASSDLTRPDSISGQPNRYEIGLFDLRSNNKNGIYYRYEDLFIKYKYKNSHFIFGRQAINTAFINPQDGRMRPTYVEGLTFEINELKKVTFKGGWLYKIAPRSTTKWFGIGESIGIYPTGLNPDGSPSKYAGNISSDWISYFNVNYKINRNLSLELWNQHIDRIINSSLAQANLTFQLSAPKDIHLNIGGQFIYQKAQSNGGNDILSKTYTNPGNEAYIFSSRIELEKKKKGFIQVNYTRITKNGRYLMPREWGKDPMFTFLPRERVEGMADVHAFSLVGSKTLGKSGFKLNLGIGTYQLADAKNAAFNKYAIPAFRQYNFDLRYNAIKYIKGLDFQLLIAYKERTGESYANPRLIVNKVDMTNYNLVINYNF